MKYYVGELASNHAPISNGKVLALLQQFQGGRAIDRVHRLLYPYFDRESSLLGEAGIHTVARDSKEDIRYDFYQGDGLISVDGTRYIDGTGIYETLSHKGYIRVRTTTWIPQNVDGLVRKIEVASQLRERRDIHIYPQIHLRGEIYRKDNIIFSKVNNYGQEIFLAVTCPEAEEWHYGDLEEGLEKAFNMNIGNEKTRGKELIEVTFPHPWLSHIPYEEELAKKLARLGRKPNLSFGANREVVSRKWSKPVHLIIGLGKSEAEALENLKKITAPDYLYKSTYNNWNKWLDSGTQPKISDHEVHYMWRLSNTMLKTCLQENELPVFIGYWRYQGGLWFRDGLWAAICLAITGHLEDSLEILKGFKKIVKKRNPIKNNSWNY